MLFHEHMDLIVKTIIRKTVIIHQANSFYNSSNMYQCKQKTCHTASKLKKSGRMHLIYCKNDLFLRYINHNHIEILVACSKTCLN